MLNIRPHLIKQPNCHCERRDAFPQQSNLYFQILSKTRLLRRSKAPRKDSKVVILNLIQDLYLRFYRLCGAQRNPRVL